MQIRIATLSISIILAAALTTFAQDDAPIAPNQPPRQRVALKTFGNARFTCLADGIVRMEYDARRRFEDRPTFAFMHRNRRDTFSQVRVDDKKLTLLTPRLSLTYTDDGRPFHPGNLVVSFLLNGNTIFWKPGLDDSANLRGTFRTLDGISGATDLERGLLSRDGWAVVDDSDSPAFELRDNQLWPVARDNGDAIDWYIFAYGHDYKTALADFTRVAGHIPIPPRYAFGAWWSRYWAYSEKELRKLVDEFDEHDVPLDVLVIDMDWHLDGWTGYTWNRKYFPDPDGFLEGMDALGLKTTLNLHPADGVGKHERQFKDMCRAMGLDPATTDRVPFDATDPRFVDAYFKILHHPIEQQGIDFWWMDWQQGSETNVPGLDPLPWLNHLHWIDMARRIDETGKRPLIFSRWGGLGNHRYQIGFSGDTFCNWQSLAFQPYFTATAANVGFGYWSHDIGGHQPGRVDPELYARWIQFGTFSPILRTHTTKNPEAERRIWMFPPDVYDAAKKAFQLRYHLIPYIYTASRESFDTGVSICRPLYYDWPELADAYDRSGGYLFGDALFVAPVTQPADPASGLAAARFWLPPGRWRNGFTGDVIDGPTKVQMLVPLDEIPVFVREGHGIPAMPVRTRAGEDPIETLVVHLFHQRHGETSTTRLYEDDNISDAYQSNEFSRQTITTKGDDDDLDITIAGAEGSYRGMPTNRTYEIRVEDSWPPEEVKVNGDELNMNADPRTPGWHYLPESLTVVIRTPNLPIRDEVDVELEFDDDAKDRRVLDAGLRGKLRIVRDVEQILGDSTPEAIRQLNTKVRSLATNPAAAPTALRQLPEQWPDLVAAVAQSFADEEAKQKALIRIRGLMTELTVTPHKGAAPSLDARLDIATTVRARGTNQLIGNASIAVDSPWKINGDTSAPFNNQGQGPALSRAWNITMDDAGAEADHVWQSSAIQLKVDYKLPMTGNDVARGPSTLTIEKSQIVLPSINAWHIVGPFDAGPQTKSLAKHFPPEGAPIDLTAAYKGKNDKDIRWRKRVRELKPGDNLTEEFFTDFDDFYGGRVYDAVAYAVTWLDVPDDTDAVLAIGTDDGVVAWLNGEEVHRNDVGRPYTSKQDRVNIRLKKGINELRLKVNQGGGDWAFAAHVETPTGNALPGLKVRLSPN